MQYLVTPSRSRLLPGWPGSVKLAEPGSALSAPLTFTGYGSVFSVLDRGGDVVMPGAFAASLARHAAEGTRPKGLWQHCPEQPILTWTAMAEDAHGLLCTGRLLPGVEKADEAAILIRAGEIDALSIGFEVVASRKISWHGLQAELGLTPSGGDGDVRALDILDLWEVSPVTFPMCEQARFTDVKDASGPAAATAPPTASALGAVKPAPNHDHDLASIMAALHRRGASLSRIA